MARSRSVIPNKANDGALLALMVVGLPLAVVWLGGFVLPNYHSSLNWVAIFHISVAGYVITSIFWNMFLLMRTDASGHSSILPIILKPGWHYCHDCQLNAPPRSYHCYICNECILKRDHHCNFTGCCVGYHNHRYYLIGVFYIWFGALYGVIYEWEYCYTTIGSSYLGFLTILIAPHLAFVLRFISIFQFIVAQLHLAGCVVLMISTYLLTIQLIAVCRGQTQYERKHQIKTFDLGSLRRNIREVLGSRMFITCFLPFIESPLPGDGLKFVEGRYYEDVKDM